MDRETELRLALDEITQRYEAERKPIIDELTEIARSKPAAPIIINANGTIGWPTRTGLR